MCRGCLPTKDSFQFIYLSGGSKVGIIGLKEIMDECHCYGKPPTSETASEIVEGLKDENYIVPTALGEYQIAVLIEYQRYLKNENKNKRWSNMKIIVSSKNHMGLNSEVGDYPDKCPYYTLVNLKGDKIEKVTNIENGSKQSQKSIEEQKADVFIAGKISREMQKSLQKLGVEVVVNASGRVADVIHNYIIRR